MGMAGIGSRLALLAILFVLNAGVGSALAQTNNFDVLIDLDRNPATGCNIAAPNGVSGIERRIRASVDSATATVTSVTVELCQGASFGPPIQVGGPHPVGLNTGINASDVVELSAPFNTLDLGTSNPLQLIFRAADSNGSDLLATVDGSPNGGPIFFGLPISVPTLSAAGIALLAVLLFLWAWRQHRRGATAVSMVLLLFAAGLVVAVNFVTDGNIGDWIGEPARATDPSGDSTNGSPGNDIQAAFFASENSHLFFRLDITDLESQPPLANDDNFALDEDTTLNTPAPGVLGNDSDPGMAPLTAVLITGPTNAASFTLNTDGSFTYQPAADFNGNDSFTYVADNGASTSAVATVSLLVNPINDPPQATDDTVSTNEDNATVIAVLGNDSDVDGNLDPSSVTVTTPAGNGTTLVNPANGAVTYTKNGDFNGADSFQYQVCDTGTPLPALCATATVNITVDPVNDAPSFTVGPDQTVLEDSGAQTINAWATAISAGPANEAGQTLSFIFSGNTNPALFAAGPAVDGAGNLSFTPAANANGSATLTVFLMDNGGTANGGVDSSAPASFSINVTAVNDAPSFVAGPSQSVLEDSGAQTVNGWATAISAGPADEAGQVLSFNVVGNDNPGLFSVAPSVDNAGNLTYTPAANINGTANIMLTLSDNGGTANGGADTSAAALFSITVDPVNDAPSFTVGSDQTVLEDSGAQTVNGWATAISAGPANEAGQALNFIFSGNTNPALFAAGPAVDAAGNLSYTPAANANGSATLSLFLMDDGGTANGGVDSSATVSFTINITAVNDAPSFVAGPNQSVLEDSGAQSVNGWATAISAGPADEASQALSFNIAGNDNPGLFSVAPSVDNAGNLTYTPAANTSGIANITLTLSDNGGTANGGVDTSAPAVFSITVNEVNDAPFFTAGVNPAVNEDSGAQSLPWASTISAGPPSEAGQALNFVLTPVSVDSTLSFSAGPSVNAVSGNVEFTAAANAYGVASYNVVLQDNGGTANGGVDTFGPLSLTITINPLNDAPTFSGTPTYFASTNIEINIPAGSGLLVAASDEATEASDPAGPALPGTLLTVGNGANPPPTTTANGGNLSIDSVDGSFSYNPPPGFVGGDSFSFVVCDNGIGTPAAQCSAPVNAIITVIGPTVWFIDNNVSGGGNDGRLSSPFESLAAFNARQGGGGVADPAPGDFIFLTGSATAYSDGANGISLSDNQTLFGHGTTGISFDALTGLTPPAGSVARPILGGASPTLTSTNSGVSLSTTAGNANTLRGFTIGNTTAGYALTGSMAGTLNVLEVDIQGQGGLINLNGLGSGILNAAFTAMNSISAQGTSFFLQNMLGGILTSASTSIQAPAAGAILISNNTPAIQVNFGTLANLSTTAGAGFILNNAGSVTIAGNPSLSTVGGPALQISDTTLVGFNFSSLSANGSVNGINLNTVSGNISAAAGTIQNSSAVGVTINAGVNDFSYAGSITTSVGRALQVNNQSSGTISIGNITNTTQGVQLTNNSGALIRFTGTMTLNTGANAAFIASGGGTLEATGANSSITTTTGIPVNINSVNFSPSNFTLRSVSTNGAASGIILVNTGNTGGFIVNGDGSNARNGSGGTIQNTTGDGVMLLEANNIRLSSVNFINVGDSADSMNGGNTLANNDHAIQSERGGSIVLSGVHVMNPAAGGWEAVDLGGNNRIDNDSLFEGINVSNMQALEVRNTDTNMPGFVINNSRFTGQASSNGSSYVIFSSFGTSNMVVRVENGADFDNIFGNALQANAGESIAATGAVDLTIVNSNFSNAVDGTVGVGASGGIGGVVVSAREDAINTFNINGNTWSDLGRPLANAGVLTIQGIAGLNKLLDGSVANNNTVRIGYPTAAEVTTTVGHRFMDVVTENDITRLDLEVDSNTIDDTSREAYFASSRGASRDFDLAIRNNNLGLITAIGRTDREAIEILSEDSSDMEALVMGNQIIGNTSALDQVVDIDTENTSFMDMIFIDNSVSNLQAAGGFEITVDTENGTSTHCMRFINNTAAEVVFTVNGLYSVENFTNIAANNPSVGAFLGGVGVTNVATNTCISPSF